MNEEKTTTISMKRLAELLKAELILDSLRSGGVDAWDWHGDSLPDREELDEIDQAAKDGTLTAGE